MMITGLAVKYELWSSFSFSLVTVPWDGIPDRGSRLLTLANSNYRHPFVHANQRRRSVRSTRIMPLASNEHLLLDSSIRDFVVLPLVLLLVLVGICRHFVSELIKSIPTISENEVKELRYKQTLGKSQRLRLFGHMINDHAYEIRKNDMLRKKTGLLREKVPGPGNPMANPTALVDMMKGNVTFMLPNIAMMTFVGWFFAGFVCLKVPFPMPSNHFKLMLQRGVDLSTLNISYVSSLSWYFLVTFGLNGIYGLILGPGSEVDEAKMMQMQMGMGMNQQMGFDANAAYGHERDNLTFAKHEWSANKAEKLLLGDRYPVIESSAKVDLSAFKKIKST